MYQIRDKRENIIIARFISKEDAEKFLRLKQGEEKNRYVMVKAGEKNKK